MFLDGDDLRPNTCMYLFKRYTSAFQGWLDGGYRDRRMFCEAINLYIPFDFGTVSYCAGQLQDQGSMKRMVSPKTGSGQGRLKSP